MRYELSVIKGSGYNGANWLLMLQIPEHDIWPTHWVTIRAFETEEAALEERAKMVIDLFQQASTERR